MDIGKLKKIRFIAPAFIVLIFYKILGFITGYWDNITFDAEDLSYSPIAIGIGALYYITPVRGWINAPHHAKVTENLRKGIVRIGNKDDDPEIYTWKTLRSLFFKIIDNDRSLSIKAKLAYWNGLIWTSCADFTAISIAYSLTALFMSAFFTEKALPAILLFLLFSLIGFICSWLTTKRHMEIGNEQLEIIEMSYKGEVATRLREIG